MIGTRDEKGWHISNRLVVFHPHSYGIATLMRIGFKTPGGRQVLLHHFRPHDEREFHDHPWDFRTFVLWGTYIDESIAEREGGETVIMRERMRWGTTRFRSALHAHRTSCKGHVWTLVITSPKKRSWCKGTPQKWICGGRVADFDELRGMVKVED